MIVLPSAVQTAVAQNNDQNKKQEESTKSDTQTSSNQSNQGQNQNQNQQSQNDSKAPAEKQGPALSGSASSQTSASSQNSGAETSAQNNTQASATNRDSNDTSSQSNTSRYSSRDSNTQSTDRSSANSDRSQSRDDRSDRSLLNNDRVSDRDSDRSRDSRDRGDNRDSNRHSRDFHNDFKFGKVTNRGITVSTITHGSIFYRAGLRDGDVIISYNNRPIRSQDDFYRVVVYQPGQRVPVVVLRDGREETVYVVYEEDVAQGRSTGGVYFGAEFDEQSNNGAVIVRVDRGSPADQAGLQRDDVVLALNGDRVNSGRDAMQIIDSMNNGERVEVEFSRHARTDVTLGGSQGTTRTTDTNVDRASHETSVATGVDTDRTRRTDRSSSNYNSNSSRNRSDDRNTNRSNRGGGLLRGLRN
jgi:C-terminal processing protease CtpA/Prc